MSKSDYGYPDPFYDEKDADPPHDAVEGLVERLNEVANICGCGSVKYIKRAAARITEQEKIIHDLRQRVKELEERT